MHLGLQNEQAILSFDQTQMYTNNLPVYPKTWEQVVKPWKLREKTRKESCEQFKKIYYYIQIAVSNWFYAMHFHTNNICTRKLSN